MVKRGDIRLNNSSKILGINKVAFFFLFGIIVVAGLALAISSNYAGSSVTGNVIARDNSWLCMISADFCHCTISRWCVDSDTYAARGQDCRVVYNNCVPGQYCSAGYCVQENCTNECSTSGTRQCSGNGYRTCGNYDSDSCLEWGSVTSCSAGESCSNGNCVPQVQQTCTDSDGGINYPIQGTVFINNTNGTTLYTDYCQSGSHLSEYYCNGNQPAVQQNILCSNGCSNGACAQQSNLSDLNITNVMKQVHASNIGVIVQIKNGGQTTAVASSARIHAPSTGQDFYVNYPSIAPGVTVTKSVNFSSSTTGAINVTADVFSQVPESNELNNRYYSSDFFGGLPDLNITWVMKQVNPNNIGVTVRINNNGQANAGPSSTRLRAFNPSQTYYVNNTGIPAGGSIYVYANFTNSTTGAINVSADVFSQVPESNELNNWYFNSGFFG